MLLAIAIEIHNGKFAEEFAQLLASEVVVRQAGFAAIEWDIGSRLDALKLCALIFQRGHADKKEAAGFENASYFTGQGGDLHDPGVMNDLDRDNRVEKGLLKRQAGEDVVLSKPGAQPGLFQALARRSYASGRAIDSVYSKASLGEIERVPSGATAKIEQRASIAPNKYVRELGHLLVGLREHNAFARENAIPDG